MRSVVSKCFEKGRKGKGKGKEEGSRCFVLVRVALF